MSNGNGSGLEGTLVMDAVTFIDSVGATGEKKPTFAWVTRQNAASGTMLSKNITTPCFLIAVAASTAITVAKAPVTYPTNGSQFSDGFIAHIPPTSLKSWIGRAQLNQGDIIYVDSLSGLGSSDSFVMTFENA